MFNYSARPDLLANRTILITGAGEGIGRTAALCFARHGATVVLLGRTTEKLTSLYDEIEAAGYPQAAVVPLDLATATMSDYQQLAHLLEQEFGSLDGLLHNAAVLGDITVLQQYDPDTWDHVLAVNLSAPFRLTQTLLPLLKASADASVVFTSSSVGRRGRAFWGAYAVSKAGVESLTQILADELDNTSNIRVNCINPGGTHTRMRRYAYPAENPAQLPLPQDIMSLYLYLMGPDSLGVSGQSLDAQGDGRAMTKN